MEHERRLQKSRVEIASEVAAYGLALFGIGDRFEGFGVREGIEVEHHRKEQVERRHGAHTVSGEEPSSRGPMRFPAPEARRLGRKWPSPSRSRRVPPYCRSKLNALARGDDEQHGSHEESVRPASLACESATVHGHAAT